MVSVVNQEVLKFQTGTQAWNWSPVTNKSKRLTNYTNSFKPTHRLDLLITFKAIPVWLNNQSECSTRQASLSNPHLCHQVRWNNSNPQVSLSGVPSPLPASAAVGCGHRAEQPQALPDSQLWKTPIRHRFPKCLPTFTSEVSAVSETNLNLNSP